MLGYQGYSQGQQNRRASRTGSTPGPEGLVYSFSEDTTYKPKTMKRECKHVKNSLSCQVTWVRVLSLLFVAYFFYKVSFRFVFYLLQREQYSRTLSGVE